MQEKGQSCSEETSARPPLISTWLAYSPMSLLVAAAMGAWFLPARPAVLAVHLDIILAGSLLCFLAGVRRGLSFRQAGGAARAQLLTMLLLFGLGFGGLAIPDPVPALFVLLTGYAAIWLLDPVAARRREVPIYFASLRRKQMLLPILGIALLIAKCLTAG